jgi:pyruvate dehydrogenase E1 component
VGLRARIDAMSNEEYQRLLVADAADLRERIPGDGPFARDVKRIASDLDDRELAQLVRDLGGHDLGDLIAAFREADSVTDRPSVIFAYTLKGWRLPVEGHPRNHSALLTDDQWRRLAVDLKADADDPWAAFKRGSDEARLCSDAADRLARTEPEIRAIPPVPVELARAHRGSQSTQQAFGRFFSDLGREAPEVAKHVVTVSPDVASSTNLGGWLNRVGIWNLRERRDWFEGDAQSLVRWRESGQGQHIELGIAEGNLVGLLGELGLTWARDGQPIVPIGTLYDPFVNRALEPWSFGIYSGGQSILVGTPSGVTLAPEGGAHQSIITPSVGLEQPGCVCWEPAFGQDFEWALLQTCSQLGRPGGTSAYFRLSTRPIDQALAAVPEDPAGRSARRHAVLSGGYRLREAEGRVDVTLVGVGAIMPEVVGAAAELASGGIAADVICLTSPGLVFRALQARQGLLKADYLVLDELFPASRAAPIVTVMDGHPHTLAFLGAVRAVPIASLGVSDFGQSGDVQDLYEYFGIDVDTIVGAALDLIQS